MQSQEFHETLFRNRVCANSDTENVTPIIAGKDSCLNNNKYNAKKSFRRYYNCCFNVYVCRVNKCKDNCGYSGRSEALSENVEELYNDCNYCNDEFCHLQNRKAKVSRNFCNKWGIKGLATNKKEKETKYSCQAKPLPTWCENVTILNNNPTRNRIVDSRLPYPVTSNKNDNLAINEISNLLTYLKSVGGDSKKNENWPHMYIPILEKCLHCEKEMALERLKKIRNHKNVCTKIDPGVDMFLEPKTICKKNKYFKGFCGRIFLRQDGSTSKPCSPRKEKITNTYITCFEKSPPKSCVINKKITFTPNKKAYKKPSSLNGNCNYATVPKYCDGNQMSCKKHLFMENMNKFLALNTLLEEKTEAEKVKILKCLANNGVCLPAAKTKSEKKIFNKVRKELRAKYKKTDKEQCTNNRKLIKVDFLKPFRCKSYNVSTCTMSQNQFTNEENFERKCGRGVIKSSPIIHNNNEKIYEILAPPSRRQTVKGKIRNDFIRAMGRIKLKKVQTDNGDLNLLRKCSRKEKGLWYLIKNNCRVTNRAVMAALTTPDDESCAQSTFLKKTRQYCQCDAKKCNENHSIIKIELSPYIYPLGEDENGNTKRLLYNSKNVKVTIGRVKVQNMWQLKYFKNLIGKSNTAKLPSKTIDVKGTCSLIYEKPCSIDHQQNKSLTENVEGKKYWRDDINLRRTNLINERKLSEIHDKHYIVLQTCHSADDLKRLASKSSSYITMESKLPSLASLSKQLEIRENFQHIFSWPYNLARSILHLNSNYPAVYFKNNSELNCKNNIRLIPLGRSSMFLNSRSFTAIEVDPDKKWPTTKEYCGKNTNNKKIKEKHLCTNVFVISTKTKEYRSLDHIYNNKCNSQYKSNHFHERPSFTSINAQSSKVHNTKYYSKCDITQGRSYEFLNVFEIHNTKNTIHKNFGLEKIDSETTFVVQCNAKYENCFHVLEKLTGVQRDCCIINQATEKRIRFECPDDRPLRENKGYTELSVPNRQTRHTTSIRDNDREYSKYRVLDPVLSLENSISKFKNRIETTLKKRRETKKRHIHQISSPEATSNDSVEPDDSSDSKNNSILKEYENDSTKNCKEILPAESRNRGILKMNEHGDKNDYNEISSSQTKNRSILKPQEQNITKIDSQTSPIELRNRGIVKLPKQNNKKMHCLTPPFEPRNTNLAKQQERHFKQKYCRMSPPESINFPKLHTHNNRQTRQKNNRQTSPLDFKYRDVSKLHENEDKKADSQTSPLDLPNRGVLKKHERDFYRKDTQNSPRYLRNRDFAKRHEHNVKQKDCETSSRDLKNRGTAKRRERNVKKKESQTSPLNLRNRGAAKMHEHQLKTTDSQTSPLDSKNTLLEEDCRKEDSQTSPLDLRNKCIPKLQNQIIKIRDSETSPLDLAKRDTVILHRDDIKKRDSQTSPLDLTKRGVDDIKRRDSQTSPIDLTKKGVVKLVNDDVQKRDSETSPFNLRNRDLRDEEEKSFEPKSKNYQYCPKTKSEESFEPESKNYQYWPKTKSEESFEPENKDYQYWPKTKSEESFDPESKDYQYWLKTKSEESFEPENKDYQYWPKTKSEESFEPESKDYQYWPKTKSEDSFEPESKDYQYWPEVQREKLFEPQYENGQEGQDEEDEESSADEDNQYWPKTQYVDPECDDFQYYQENNYGEPIGPKSGNYKYDPKMICNESFGSKYGDFRPIKRKCDKESSILECFKQASRRRLCTPRSHYEQRRKISSYSRGRSRKRKLRGRRFRWKCTSSSNNNILSNIVKRSKSHFERISSNPRPIAQTPRTMACRKKFVCPPITSTKSRMICDIDDYGYKNREHELTYSDFKVFTKEELQWIISNCSDSVPKNIETPSHYSIKDAMTSEEEMMFYSDYASMYKDLPSTEECCDWEGIKFQVRPNRCASKKWWSIFRTLF